MQWIKALHIIFVISWFAGLFYLPRLFVNHAMETNDAATARLTLMEQKLYRFMTPLAALALAFGLWHYWRMAACQASSGRWLDSVSSLLRQADA